MWVILADATSASAAANDNLWTFLGILATALIGSGGVLAVRRRRTVEHDAPRQVAEAVTDELTPYLRQRVVDLEREVNELRTSHDADVRSIAELKAENHMLRLGGRRHND